MRPTEKQIEAAARTYYQLRTHQDWCSADENAKKNYWHDARQVLSAALAVEAGAVGVKHEFVADWYRPARCQHCGGKRYHPLHALTTSPASSGVEGEAVAEASDLYRYCGADAYKWAEQFRLTALRLGYSDMDHGWLIGWFANAIEYSISVRHPASPAPQTEGK